MSIWRKHVKSLRKAVQSYYDEYLTAQGAVEKARLDLEEAQREERAVRRSVIYSTLSLGFTSLDKYM